jgi:hypothetical protein
MDDRQPSLGLPPASTRNLANTTNPIPPAAATPRHIPHAHWQLATQAKGPQSDDLTGPTPSWMTQRGAYLSSRVTPEPAQRTADMHSSGCRRSLTRHAGHVHAGVHIRPGGRLLCASDSVARMPIALKGVAASMPPPSPRRRTRRRSPASRRAEPSLRRAAIPEPAPRTVLWPLSPGRAPLRRLGMNNDSAHAVPAIVRHKPDTWTVDPAHSDLSFSVRGRRRKTARS